MRHHGLVVVCTAAMTVFALSAASLRQEPTHARVTVYDNVHIQVPDPAAARAWYLAHLGATTDTPDNRIRFKDGAVTIVRKTDARPSTETVIDHIALSFADLNAVRTRLESAGMNIPAIANGLLGIPTVMFLDPWGVQIEAVQDAGALGFHHVHLSVPDPPAVLSWYQQRIGGVPGTLNGHRGLRYDKVWVLAEASRGVRRPSLAGAIMNVAWRVRSVPDAVEELRGKGVRIVSEARQVPSGAWFAFVEGPDGIHTELLSRAE